MWRWIAEHARLYYKNSFKVGDAKYDYLKLNKYLDETEPRSLNICDSKIRNRCFCCEYVKKQIGVVDCTQCPIKWGLPFSSNYHIICEMGKYSPYRKLRQEIKTEEEFKRLCLEIAELPVNEEARRNG